MLIPVENIARRDEGEGPPVLLEVETLAENDESPVVLMGLSIPLTPEEVERATNEMKEKLAAMATLMGREAEIPPALQEKLDELEGTDVEHRAVVFGPFEVCWN